MNAIVLSLVMYGLLSTAILIYQHKRRPKLPEAGAQLLQIIPTFTNPADKANSLVELAKLEHELRPWWERALSTIGIVAFASMSIATTVQTLNATVAQHKLELVQAQVVELTDQIKDSKDLIAALAHGALERFGSNGGRDPSAKKLLTFRLEQLVGVLSPTSEEMREAYAIAIALEKYEIAYSFLDDHPELLNKTIPADIVTLAEYYYLSGSEEQAREILELVKIETTKLPKYSKLRMLYLDIILNGDKQHNLQAIEAILKISPDRANAVVNQEIERLKMAQSKVRMRSETK